jgi:hypothetical protein
VPIVLKSGNLNLLELSGPVKAYNGIAFTPDGKKFMFEIYSRVSILMNILYLFTFLVQLTEQSTEITAA